MWMDEVFERFVEKSPFSVMTRATLERLFADSFLDQVFQENAVAQYEKQLSFSAVTSLLTQVVLRYRPSLRDAYRRSGPLAATLKSVYGKLAGVETAVSVELVRQTALRAAEVLDCWPQARRPDPVPGLRLRVLDGNYLAGTQHRLDVLRGGTFAALPGMSVVLREDRSGLLSRLACREDAYTNERALLGEVLGWVEADDLIVADRNFCFFDLLLGLGEGAAYFVIRHHEQVGLTELTALRHAGTSEGGEVYEQQVEVGPEGARLRLRCVVVKLFEPTQEGETEVRLLSNVAGDKASALVLAEAYLRRWRVEHSFQELTEQLRCEVDTLGYPKAALLGFSLAVCAYNLWGVLKGALAAVHGQQKVEAELSGHALAQDVSQDSSGLNIALPDSYWRGFAAMSCPQFAAWLVGVARRLPWQTYRKAKRSPRKTPPDRPEKQKGSRRDTHRSTARLLLLRQDSSQ
jgi:Transposase DDE domain